MSDKYQKEIEDILKQAEGVMPGDKSWPQAPHQPEEARGVFKSKRRIPLSGSKISAGKLMLTSFAMLILALILSAVEVPYVVVLIAAGLVLFVAAFGLFFVRSGSGPSSSYERRWRGRLIEEEPGIWDRVKRWLRS